MGCCKPLFFGREGDHNASGAREVLLLVTQDSSLVQQWSIPIALDSCACDYEATPAPYRPEMPGR